MPTRRDVLGYARYLPPALVALGGLLPVPRVLNEQATKVEERPTPADWLKSLETHIPGVEHIIFIPGPHLIDPSVAAPLHSAFVNEGKMYNFFQSEQGLSPYAQIVADLTKKGFLIAGTAPDSLNTNLLPAGDLPESARENAIVIGIGTVDVFQGGEGRKPHGVFMIGTDHAYYTMAFWDPAGKEFTRQLQNQETNIIQETDIEVSTAEENIGDVFSNAQTESTIALFAAYIMQAVATGELPEGVRQLFENVQQEGLTRRILLPILGVGGATIAVSSIPALLGSIYAALITSAAENATGPTTTPDENGRAAKEYAIVVPQGPGENWADARIYKNVIATAFAAEHLKIPEKAKIVSPWGDEHATAVGARYIQMQETIQQELRERMDVVRKIVQQLNNRLPAGAQKIDLQKALQAAYDVTVHATIYSAEPFTQPRDAKISVKEVVVVPQMVEICKAIAARNKLKTREK